MLDKIEILKDNNDKITVDFINAFKIKFNDIEKSFIIITTNELDQNGMIKLCVSEIIDNKLVKVANDDDWGKIKIVMRSIISSSNGDFTYITIPRNIKAAEDFFRVIAVQESAKTQLISDYIAKKPVEEEAKIEPKKPEVDENVAIYPKDNPQTTIGSEIVPGIMEETAETIKEVVDEPAIDLPIPPKIEEPVKNEEENKTESIEPIVQQPTVPTNEATSEPVSPAPKIEEPTIPEVAETSKETEPPLVGIPKEEIKTESPETELTKIEEPKIENPTIESTNAEEILFNKIKEAVQEYIKTSGGTQNSDEVLKLKQELEEKNKKLENIMSLINPKG